jgi:hypothetical protein
VKVADPDPATLILSCSAGLGSLWEKADQALCPPSMVSFNLRPWLVAVSPFRAFACSRLHKVPACCLPAHGLALALAGGCRPYP